MNKIKFDKALVLYILKSKQNGFFVSEKSINGEWTQNVNEARIYTKIGIARQMVTKLYQKFPTHGILDIIECSIKEAIVLEEKNRVLKSIQKIKNDTIEQEKKTKKRKLDDIDTKIQMLEKEKQQLSKE